jgi:aconitate hydratase
MLRKRGVVAKFVEYFGPGVASLSIADRATLGNMSPEYGATCGFFPIDDDTIRYLRDTGRPADRIALVIAYAKAQGLYRTKNTPDPVFTDVLKLELSSIGRSGRRTASPSRRSRTALPRRWTRSSTRPARWTSACRSTAAATRSAMATL